MNIDEAIRHCEEVAWENDRKAMCVEEAYQTTEQQNCEQCAADHRQLAEWLTELKEAKRLLKLAIEDIYNARRGINCGICDMPKNDIGTEKRCEVDNVQPECKYRWRYADEAEKLLNDEK